MIEWREPPALQRHRLDWAQTAKELRRHPHAWGVLRSNVARSNGYAMAKAIREAHLDEFAPAGSFEAVCRQDDMNAGRTRLFARYIGDETRS